MASGLMKETHDERHTNTFETAAVRAQAWGADIRRALHIEEEGCVVEPRDLFPSHPPSPGQRSVTADTHVVVKYRCFRYRVIGYRVSDTEISEPEILRHTQSIL